MRGIVIFPRDDHYQPTIATQARSYLCKTGQVSFNVTQVVSVLTTTMGFTGLIARFHVRGLIRETMSTENGKGAYTRGGGGGGRIRRTLRYFPS